MPRTEAIKLTDLKLKYDEEHGELWAMDSDENLYFTISPEHFGCDDIIALFETNAAHIAHLDEMLRLRDARIKNCL